MKPIQLLLATLPLLGALSVEQVQAQVVTPASDGTDTTVTTNGNQIDINDGQTSGDGANLFHSFEQFGLNQSQTANFISNPNIQNILARVSGGDASVINGTLQVTGSNANLFLINPSGIIFGANASLNLNGAFTASTANGIGFGSNWFSATGANNYASLTGTPSAFAFTMEQPGAIINAGNLSVGEGQNLTLLAGSVATTGELNAPGGAITVAAVPGKSIVRLSQAGNVLSLDVQPMTTTSTAPNNWTLPILSLPQLLTGGGGGNATGLAVSSNGQVELTGSGLKVDANTGTVIASGSIDASSNAAGKTGGSVQILGNKVNVIDAQVNASGSNGGGNVLIVGGDYQDKGKVPNASETYVSEDSVITADSLLDGDGGSVIVWADNTTKFYGDINARGGSRTGNGGFVEVLGRQQLDFQGTVDLSAANGNFGTLLLRPDNIIIVNGSVAGNSDPTTSEIAETTLEAQTGNVILAATNDITVVDLTDNTLGFINAGSVTFTADADNNGVGAFSMVDLGDTIETNAASLSISSASIKVGNIISGDFVTLNTTPGKIVVGNLTAGNSINIFGNSGIEAGKIALNNGSLDSPNAIELRVPAGDIKVKTINNETGGDINIVTSGLFQATEVIDLSDSSDLQDFVSNNPTFIEFFKNKTGLTEKEITDFYNTLTVFGFELPVSVLAGNEGKINIQHGGEPVVSGSSFITIQGGDKDIPFVVGGIPSGKLEPEINDEYVVQIDGNYQAIDSMNYQNFDRIFKNETYGSLIFGSTEFPNDVSGTAGTIAVRSSGNGGLFASIPGRVFTPPPEVIKPPVVEPPPDTNPPPVAIELPPVVDNQQPEVAIGTNTNNTDNTNNDTSTDTNTNDNAEDSEVNIDQKQVAITRQPETQSFGILVLDKTLVASLESKNHATSLSVNSNGNSELTGSDLNAEDEEKISQNQRLSLFPGIYLTDNSYENFNK